MIHHGVPGLKIRDLTSKIREASSPFPPLFLPTHDSHTVVEREAPRRKHMVILASMLLGQVTQAFFFGPFEDTVGFSKPPWIQKVF